MLWTSSLNSLGLTKIVGPILFTGDDNIGKLVHRHKEYIVIEDDYRKGHIIINTKGKYKNHGVEKSIGLFYYSKVGENMKYVQII